MIEMVNQSKHETEALLILNALTLQKDFYQEYHFKINVNKLNPKIRENKLIMERLDYLNSN